MNFYSLLNQNIYHALGGGPVALFIGHYVGVRGFGLSCFNGAGSRADEIAYHLLAVERGFYEDCSRSNQLHIQDIAHAPGPALPYGREISRGHERVRQPSR